MASGHSGGSLHESSSSGGGDDEYESNISSFFNNIPPNFPHQNPSSYYNPHAIPSQNLHLYPESSNFQYSNTNITDCMIWPAGISLTQSMQASPQENAPPARPESTKNPRKRTRASRRAPTTVLTTDTTNFRQMVQEFTGIPAAPFPRRVNLLSGGSALRPGDGIGPLYSFLPQQNIAPPPLSSSSPAMFNSTMIDAIVTSSNKNTAVLSDQGLLRLQNDHNPNLHQFEAGGSIDFGNYISDSAAAGDLRNNDDGIQEKFMPFDRKI